MRPTLVLALATALVAGATLAGSALAQSTPPQPQISVSGGTITVTAQGNTHVNSGFPWYVKDGNGNKVKKLADFNFSGGSAGSPQTATVSGAPAGTLRGGYCQDTGCFTFTASCTTTACTITGI
jgi:hypothetical protein